MSINNFAFQKISQYLSNEKYHIPEYQRGYSWESDQFEDFWVDLVSLIENPDLDIHFLGQIVVHNNKDEKKKYIIDGQQRTTTSVIFLDVFREFFKNMHSENNIIDANYDSSDITSHFIGRISDTKQDQKLFLGKSNRDFFKEFIQQDRVVDLTKEEYKKLNPSNKKIVDAKNFFKDKLEEVLSIETTALEKYELLSKYFMAFTDHFNVMYVETDDINEAYIIFETLNARGKELETADLLKNHIL